MQKLGIGNLENPNFARDYFGGGAIEAATGGLVSYAIGGDFLQGAAQGLIVYFANHLAHSKSEVKQEWEDPINGNKKPNLEDLSINLKDLAKTLIDEVCQSFVIPEPEYGYVYQNNNGVESPLYTKSVRTGKVLGMRDISILYSTLSGMSPSNTNVIQFPKTIEKSLFSGEIYDRGKTINDSKKYMDSLKKYEIDYDTSKIFGIWHWK